MEKVLIWIKGGKETCKCKLFGFMRLRSNNPIVSYFVSAASIRITLNSSCINVQSENKTLIFSILGNTIIVFN